ncbi:MAG: M48 family metallopeptidase [Metallosphaera sp.]
MLLITFAFVTPILLALFYIIIPAIMVKRYHDLDSISINQLEEKSGVKIKVKVNSDDSVNAFSLPNKVVIVTRALLNNENDLQAALAHEIGHIKGKHHIKTFLMLIGLTIISIYVILDYNLLLGIGTVLLEIIISKFVSRYFEYSADRYAVTLVGRDQYLKLLTSYGNLEEKSSIFSTHPAVINRLKKI